MQQCGSRCCGQRGLLDTRPLPYAYIPLEKPRRWVILDWEGLQAWAAAVALGEEPALAAGMTIRVPRDEWTHAGKVEWIRAT
jgi:hypothetical protein